MQLRHLVWAGLLVSGCAAHPQHVRDPDRAAEEQERTGSAAPTHSARQRASDEAVKLVAREPAKDRWEMVGKIEGEAPNDDTIGAGALAQQDLKRKAALLGAGLVKIDHVTPPADRGKRGKVVVFTARAYRALTD
jgi:uncharacterized NAD(P)/FAD-binding protein YdhS